MLPQMRRSRFLMLVFVVAMGLRLAAVLALRDIHSGPDWTYGADPRDFDTFARNLAEGRGFTWDDGRPASLRAPGWPLMLAALYRVGGVHYPGVYLMLCVLGATACVLTFYLAREVVSEGLARLAATLAVFYLPHIYLATLLISESLFIVCLALGLWALIRHLKSGTLLSGALAGLILGYSALIRPFTLLLLPLLAILIVWQFRRGGAVLLMGRLAVFGVAFVGPILPWTARNYLVYDRFVLIATNGGGTFYGSNNDIVASGLAKGGSWVSTRMLPGRPRIDAAPDDAVRDKIEWELGARWLRDHPSAIPRLLGYKLLRLWLPEWDSGNRKFVLVNVVAYGPYLLLFLLGVIGTVRYRDAAWLAIHATVIATVVTALIFWGSPRFRDANLPLLMVYAALGLRMVIQRLIPARSHTTQSLTSALVEN